MKEIEAGKGCPALDVDIKAGKGDRSREGCAGGRASSACTEAREGDRSREGLRDRAGGRDGASSTCAMAGEGDRSQGSCRVTRAERASGLCAKVKGGRLKLGMAAGSHGAERSRGSSG